jgi:wyosine [tRNA(Phe)-imidazoG37] synthetase (radical SAM superfamily)
LDSCRAWCDGEPVLDQSLGELVEGASAVRLRGSIPSNSSMAIIGREPLLGSAAKDIVRG